MLIINPHQYITITATTTVLIVKSNNLFPIIDWCLLNSGTWPLYLYTFNFCQAQLTFTLSFVLSHYSAVKRLCSQFYHKLCVCLGLEVNI